MVLFQEIIYLKINMELVSQISRISKVKITNWVSLFINIKTVVCVNFLNTEYIPQDVLDYLHVILFIKRITSSLKTFI